MPSLRSIRSRLTIYLLGGIGFLIVAASIALEINIERWLVREFDNALDSQARALVTLTKQEAGEVELDFADEFMPEFGSPTDPHYFELWLNGEELIERSNSFDATDDGKPRSKAGLPRAPDLGAQPRFTDALLPDGRSGRVIRIDFVPQVEDDDPPPDPALEDELPPHEELTHDPSEVLPGSGIQTATILVARERETLDTHIGRLGWSLFGFTAVLLATVAALIALSLRIGLRPLDRLSDQVHSLQADSLDRRVDLGSPPHELAPVVGQINELLTRLETAFKRERQLTSDIAHELKTPIAELRNLCEVGARWPDDPDSARRFFEDAWTIGLQMERIVVHLLELARFDEGAAQVRVDRVEVADVVTQAWQPLAELAAANDLSFENRVLEDAVLDTDREKLRLILSNLLSNAVDYSRPGTAIACRFEASNGRSVLTVSNCAANLDGKDVAVMFDRFWRRDSARTGGRNVGLGLAIVRAFSDLLGFEIETSLDADSVLQIRLTVPSSTPS